MATNFPDDEREARIDKIFEELRHNTEDSRPLARRATERARETKRALRNTSQVAKRTVQRKVGKKH
jgi:hypothetical protein